MKQKKIVLWLLAALNFTHILDFMIMMPLGNYLMPYFNISPKQFSWLVAAYTVSAAITGFSAAFIVDRYDRKKILLVGYVGFLIGTIACGIAPTYWLLVVSRTVAGLFGGLIGAQVLSIIADLFSYEERGKAMGTVMSAFAAASTLGVPFSLYLANLISWHAPFLFVGVIGIVLIPLLNKNIPRMTKHIRSKEDTERIWEALFQVLRNPMAIWALVFSFLLLTGHFLIIPFINPFMEFNMGFSKLQTPMIYLVGGIASLVTSRWLGRMADQHGKLKVFSISVFLSLGLVAIITNMPPISFFWILLVFGVWFIMGTGRGVTAQSMISNVVPPQQRGSFMSFNSSMQQLGTSFASFIAGFIVTSDPITHKISNYPWLGFMSVITLGTALLIARKLFIGMDAPKQ